ncbi:unnamed protein product [Meloidogyne enterolobii]|uniref:Uncharacterized protein n=1 Tax=Meloidogyne enterolobii TaxID=390850 RepID=A0ACB0Y5M4_MELEN
MVTISMPLPLFSTSSVSTYSQQFKNNKNNSSLISRHQARRVSLPNALLNNQSGGGFRSPRSRTPNSLSPKLGFLKEISEFDIDPPFISPGASSSSSADNSHCNSPMLLSPFSHRPASARPYRRNKLINQNQQQPQQSKTQEEIKQRRNVQSLRAARRSEPFILGNCEDLVDDDFKWTDVDGFYGRKNSIPLHQLLANDLALLRGIHAKNEQSNGNTPPPGTIKRLNNISPSNSGIDKNDDNQLEENNDESEDSLNSGKYKKRQESRFKRSSLEEIKKSSSAPMSSPTKRRLKMIKNKLYSLEDDQKGIKSKLNENEGLDDQNQSNSENEKVKFMDSLDELDKEKDEANDDVRLLRQILKSRRQPIQQFRHFSVDQDGQRIVDSGVRTIRSKIHQNPPQSEVRNPKARRATCPEIWLSEAEDEERLTMNCAVRLFGCNSVGKKSIAKQLASAAEVSPQDDGVIVSTGNKKIYFYNLLNISFR